MSTVAETRRDYDFTALSHVLRRAVVLGLVTAVVVVALAFVTRLMDGIAEALPQSATRTRPTVLRLDPRSEPIMALSVAGDVGLPELKAEAFGGTVAKINGELPDRESELEHIRRLLDNPPGR